MCGIAGMIDLSSAKRSAPRGAVKRMADALLHRGPDEEGYLDQPGLHLASRRLSIVGLADGQQPISNENKTVWTVFNGEFFDHLEVRKDLEASGLREHRERVDEHSLAGRQIGQLLTDRLFQRPRQLHVEDVAAACVGVGATHQFLDDEGHPAAAPGDRFDRGR